MLANASPGSEAFATAPRSEAVQVLYDRSEVISKDLENEELSGSTRQSLVAERIKVDKEIATRDRQAMLAQLLASDVSLQQH